MFKFLKKTKKEDENVKEDIQKEEIKEEKEYEEILEEKS